MTHKKIALLGSGIVGKTLAEGFIHHGYEATIGTSNPEKLKDFEAKNNFRVKVASFEDTAKNADIIVLAVKGHAAEDVLKSAGATNLSGKTIIDATNPIDEKNAPVNGVLNFFTKEESLMETLQKKYPEAHFVKAFNSVGSAFMVNPDFHGVTPSMFICGNHENAKKETTHILEQFGWEVEDMGKAEAARAIEPLCILWCIPGFLKNQWSHAFKLLKK